MCCVSKLPDRIGDPPPDRRSVVIALLRKLIGASNTFRRSFIAAVVEHQVSHAPDVDLGYHARKAIGSASIYGEHGVPTAFAIAQAVHIKSRSGRAQAVRRRLRTVSALTINQRGRATPP